MDNGLATPVRSFVSMLLQDATHWRPIHFAVFFLSLAALTEVGAVLMQGLARQSRKYEQKTKQHLDVFTGKDIAFILFNKAVTVLYLYHMLRFVMTSQSLTWPWEDATFVKVVLPLCPVYLLYDSMYCLWHRVLHLRQVYGYIHKHHHRQITPSRGHWDAVNVHPIEFVVGEYLHLIVFYMVPCHVLTVLVFNVFALLVTTVNHMQYEVRIPWLYDAKDHGTHHRLPDTNFGQYTMVWDKVIGYYHPFEGKSS